MSHNSISGVALISETAEEIGEETAYAFAEAGAIGIIVANINEQDVEEVAEKSKRFAKHPDYRAVAVKVNVTNELSVQAMIDVAKKEF